MFLNLKEEEKRNGKKREKRREERPEESVYICMFYMELQNLDNLWRF